MLTLYRSFIGFLKNWTLPVAIIGGAMIYFIFAFVPPLNGVAQTMNPIFDAALPWFLFVILFTTFCRIDYSKMRLAKWHFWVCVAQLVMVLVMVCSITYFNVQGLRRVLLECVITCIIGPCAAASAVVTDKLGGSLESMTTYTFISNLITAIMIPLFFPIIDENVVMSFGATFLRILTKVCVILVVPMLLAWLVRKFWPGVARWIVSIPDLSFYLWGCSLSIVSGITFRNIVHADVSLIFLGVIAVVSFVLCVIQFSVGRNIGRLCGSAIEGGQALGQKNTAFAIWVSSAYLNPLSSVGPGCYILWQNAINSLELWQHRKETSKK